MESRVNIICPLYNAQEYILQLNKNILKQKKVKEIKISYILTESEDDTEKILKDNKIEYTKIKKEDFSHSYTRECAAKKSKEDIIVFITEDILIKDEYWLYNLIKPIIDKEADATYSRQISKHNNIEKYTRERNYPDKSIIKTKKDLEKMGLFTFFFSNVSSAISKKTFDDINGFDNKRLSISEDMYLAYKLIMNDYRIKYCAESVVYHSHNFNFKEIYNRYKLTGEFFKNNSYLNKYKVTKEGMGLGLYILKRIFEEKRFLLLFRYPFDMIARYMGLMVGKIRGSKK